MAEALTLLRLDAEALFVVEGGRMARQNDPDRSPAPRFFFTGCAAGNFALVREDVEARLAAELRARAEAAAPWRDPAVLPAIAGEAASLLGEGATIRTGFTYRLPHGTACATEATLVFSGSTAGDALIARLAREGMPADLAEAAFRHVGDFWAPWCVALVDGAVAATAFAARLSARAAEIGVYTVTGFRGRGLAAAVTAAWSSHAELKDRALFYGCDQTNLSSQRVTARLALPRLAGTLHVS